MRQVEPESRAVRFEKPMDSDASGLRGYSVSVVWTQPEASQNHPHLGVSAYPDRNMDQPLHFSKANPDVWVQFNLREIRSVTVVQTSAHPILHVFKSSPKDRQVKETMITTCWRWR